MSKENERTLDIVSAAIADLLKYQSDEGRKLRANFVLMVALDLAHSESIDIFQFYVDWCKARGIPVLEGFDTAEEQKTSS